MSEITHVRHHSLTIGQARGLVQQAADAFAAEYDVSSEWEGDILRFHRPGVEGQMAVTESEIRLDMTLGLVMRPFRNRFVEHIEQDFDRLLPKRKAHAPAHKSAKKSAHSHRPH